MKFFGFGKKRSSEQESDSAAPSPKSPPRHHPYDEVSDDQLDQNRAGGKPPRVHPYDEVTDDQLDQNRAGGKVPRVHPYDEVSDAVLETNRQKVRARNHAYDEVDLDRTMSKINKQANGEADSKTAPRVSKIKCGNSNLNYVEVDIQQDAKGSEKRRVTQTDSTNYAGVRRNSSGQTVLVTE